jgi:hypothetical protein
MTNVTKFGPSAQKQAPSLETCLLAEALMKDVIQLVPKAEFWTRQSYGETLAAAKDAVDLEQLAKIRDGIHRDMRNARDVYVHGATGAALYYVGATFAGCALGGTLIASFLWATGFLAFFVLFSRP